MHQVYSCNGCSEKLGSQHQPAECSSYCVWPQLIARAMYSNPPQAGAHLVAEILGDSTLKQRWYKEVCAITHSACSACC